MTGRAAAALILALLLRAAVQAASQEPRIFEGPGGWRHPEAGGTTEKDLLFDDRHAGGFLSRSFYFTAYLDDRIHLEISVFQWEYGLFGGWGLQVAVAEAGGTSFVFEERIADREITLGRDRFDIRFGESRLHGRDGSYRIALMLEEFRCDLEFAGQVRPWSPGDGYAHLDRQGKVYVRYAAASPLARVRGWLTVAGLTRVVEGWGYADRGLIAAPISRMNSPTYAFRAFGPCREGEPGCILSLLRYESHPDYGGVPISVLLLIEGRRWLIAAKDASFTAGDFVEHPGMPVAYPRRFSVRLAGEGVDGSDGGGDADPGAGHGSGAVRLEGVFVASSLYHYSDVFQKIPDVFRALVDIFFDRPIIFRVLGSFRGTLTLPDGTERELHLSGHGEYTIIE